MNAVSTMNNYRPKKPDAETENTPNPWKNSSRTRRVLRAWSASNSNRLRATIREPGLTSSRLVKSCCRNWKTTGCRVFWIGSMSGLDENRFDTDWFDGNSTAGGLHPVFTSSNGNWGRLDASNTGSDDRSKPGFEFRFAKFQDSFDAIG